LAILGLFVSVVPAQNAAQAMAFARQQIASGHDSLARKTLQRVLFFDRKTYGVECYTALAYLTLRQADYAQSAFYFDLLYQNTSNDSLKYDALLGKAGALLLQSKYTQARAELLNLPADRLPAEYATRRHLYLGACLYGERKFDQAENHLAQLLPADATQDRQQLHKLMQKAKRYARKKPRTARIMSMIVPGSGQFYAGDFKNGLNSLVLNGLLVTWFVHTSMTVSFLDAGMSVGSWVFRYYGGGLRRSGEIVEVKKQERLQKNFQEVLRVLER
jgi:tetratricopeptide (TPR) repeat protein